MRCDDFVQSASGKYDRSMMLRAVDSRHALSAPRERVWAYLNSPGSGERLRPAWVEGRGGPDQRITGWSPSGSGTGPSKPLKLKSQDSDRSRLVFESEGQLAGRWTLEMELAEIEGGTCLDTGLEFEAPPGWNRWLCSGSLSRGIRRWLNYRESVLEADLSRPLPKKTLHVALTGSNGLVGRALGAYLETCGHRVTRLERGSGPKNWNLEQGLVDPQLHAGVDAIVHLAGENITAQRWSPEQRTRLRDSRVRATGRLCQSVLRMNPPPQTFISASGIGFYGDTGDKIIDETAPPGTGFLGELARDWEAAADSVRQAGVRTVHARIGMVVSPAGGALAKMLPVFRLGLGGPLGNGRQGVSWIGLDDLVHAFHHLLLEESVHGPVNLCVPQACSNKEWTSVLGRVLHRPAFLPAPALALRLVLGEMADALLLSGQYIRPGVLLNSGYTFRWPRLEDYLRFCLGQPERPV